MKKKFLKVGDPHATVTNLPELRALLARVTELAVAEKVHYVVFYGDLFHTHAWIRMEVMEAWYEMIGQLTSKCLDVIIIEGNHDQPGPKEMEGKMSAVKQLSRMFEDKGGEVAVIDRPQIIEGIGFLPYTSSAERFYEWARDLYDRGATKSLCCHATVVGSKYDNGFYAPSGFDMELVPQEQILSGHIHSYQEFGKAWYLGSPKWETAVDAELDKGVWLVSAADGKFDREGAEFISTADVVTPMRKLTVSEGEELPELDSRSKYLVEFVGSSSWISKAKKGYLGRAAIKTTYTDAKSRVRREGLSSSTIEEFLDSDFKVTGGVDRKKLIEYIRRA